MQTTDAAQATATQADRGARERVSKRRVGPGDAFLAAREVYLSGERLDMSELASNLGVGRTTLYRWCGHRERLLSDVIWSVTEERIRSFEAATKLTGKKRLREGVRVFMEATAQDPALQAFLRNETHAALRLMTIPGDGTTQHDRLVSEAARLIREENERHDMHLRGNPELVATAIVRLMEGFVYNEAIAAVEPRLDEAMDVLDFLLS
jgi:AcrR family transcriptional regulator